MTLTAGEVRTRALELGFLACGVTDLSPTPHGDVLDRWLAAGYGGTMRYLHRQAKKRKDPQRVDAAASRVIVVLDNYYSEDVEARTGLPIVARYALGEDYHRVVGRRLEALADWLRHHGATAARPYVDHGPVPERELAQRAGLGWIGKNTMLIRPEGGSWFFIGTVFTDLPLALDEPFTADHCGTCTRCLDACPTDAFVEPRLLDATRCLSYLTIEQKQPIAPDLAAHLDGRVFGCDICNEVCPWNQRFAVATDRSEYRPSPATSLAWDSLEALDDEAFRERFRNTALERVGLKLMQRNMKAAHPGT